MNLIDNENFEFKSAFDNVLQANQPIMELAGWLRSGNCSIDAFKLGIANCLGHQLLEDNRQLKDLDSSPPIQSELNDVNYRIRLANRIERINFLGSVVNRTRKRDVKEHRVVRDPQAPQITMNDIERNFYEAVTERVRQYCERYDQFEGFLLTIPQRQMCSSMPAALRAWQKKIGLIDDEIISDTLGIDSDAEKYEQKIRSDLNLKIRKIFLKMNESTITPDYMNSILSENKSLEQVNLTLLNKLQTYEEKMDLLNQSFEVKEKQIKTKDESLNKAEQIIRKLQSEIENARRNIDLNERSMKILKE